ncbi:diguanylate cyclase domain-containing protein [Bacillus sp. DJP31]|uniref:sensor domain-containing diguanylate cyclase n=1 Tax=Bacillus sp. DJP31 TaxID=3409789 RepID=UPI003BB5476F
MGNNKLFAQQLKADMFDLLISGQASTSQEFLNLFIEEVRYHFSAEMVTLFKLDNFNHSFTPEVSTNQHIVTNAENHVITKADLLNGFLKEGNSSINRLYKHNTVYVPLKTNESTERLLVLLFSIEDGGPPEENWVDIATIFSNFVSLFNQLKQTSEINIRHEQLYQITSKFHSSMNMDHVLKEVIQALREVYPDFTYCLLLSHDNNNLDDLPIKEIQYEDPNLPATQAYVTGEMQVDVSKKDKTSTLYVPLKGKQGIYGVLQVIPPTPFLLSKKEISFITLLAATAGSALENANLYQQSKRIIENLQLINETSHQLNSNLRLAEAMNFMSMQIMQSFKAEEVGFILLENDATKKVLPGSTNFFLSDKSSELLQYVLRKIEIEKDPVFIGELKLDWSKNETEYRSLMAVPMVQSGNLRGVAIVVHKEAYFFTFETFKLLQALIHHSTLALTNSMLREELEQLVITDHLTKLHSRAYLNEKINKSMASDAFGTFILVDLDNFKKINDTFGHQVGDDVLKQVAAIIRDNIREFDIGARWGGEELAIYLPRVDLSAGIAVAERLVQRVEQSTKPKVTISCGVGHWEKGLEDSPITLFKRADEALYHAKGTGKNKVCVQHY